MILGIELGSTRIKSVLIERSGAVVAQGSYEWENKLVNGLWTYSLGEVETGLRASYSALNAEYEKKFGEPIKTLEYMGISAMMHGYLAFDCEDNLLVPFRTWRNTNTAAAAEELSKELDFNMPQRWSASHYYQAIIDREAHADKVAFLTTLSGYVHFKLTGRKVLGIGDASGMFPVKDGAYDKDMLKKYNALLKKHGINKDMGELLPEILLAGENAGVLTEEGARFLDVRSNLQAGVPFCAPEGDAGTGMVATNAVRKRTGNVSAGTSAFVMVVMEKPLSKAYPEIDVVTTPSGSPVAMVHVNNFTSEINAWVNLFCEVTELSGGRADKGELYEKLFLKSKESDEKTGGLTGYNFLSGEPIAGVSTGRPLIIRQPEGKLDLANFMQMQIYSALGSLNLGMKILEEENVCVDEICGHGGFFKTEFVGANAMSAALNAPVTVMKNAGEGGAWGIALLALYALTKKGTLEDFLDEIFKETEKTMVAASAKEKAKFNAFIKNYRRGLQIEKLATEVL